MLVYFYLTTLQICNILQEFLNEYFFHLLVLEVQDLHAEVHLLQRLLHLRHIQMEQLFENILPPHLQAGVNPIKLKIET